MGRESVGSFEQLVMLAILRLGDGAYGASIIREIRRHTERPVLRPAVYVALGRLEERGLVRSRRDDASEARRGRPRKYVELTAEGVAQLRESRATLLSLWDGVQAVLDER
jgi:PadR family transcriptional regulator PadR